MAQSWYPFYVGDYARKTAHLSMLEHGAYRLLLDHYYATGEPLPSDNAKLFRICRARTPSERKSVLSTVAEFFTKDGTLLRSEKCDRVLNKQLNYSNSQSAKAKLRHSHGNATAMPRARVTKTRTKTKGEVSPIYTPDFDLLWGIYPRRDGSKSEAFRIFTAIIKSGEDYGRLESGIKAYANSVRGKEAKYIAHLTTFLNQRRWESDYTTPVAEQSKPDRARAAVMRGLEKYERSQSQSGT
jgi:uncharacterized protein YdaU (DUF1376 family)